jgi:hypothetical protein
MIGRAATLIAGSVLAFHSAALAQDATLEVTEATLNALLGRLGTPSDSGSYWPPAPKGYSVFDQCYTIGFLDCAGGTRPIRIPLGSCRIKLPLDGGSKRVMVATPTPLTWQWWVENARFNLAAGSMTFTATVRSRIGTATSSVSRTVPATMSFVSATNRLRIELGAFSVPLEVAGQSQPVTTVDVARLLGFSLPLQPQAFSVPLPDGGTRALNLRATSISTQYLAGRILVTIDVSF